jgi:hypothetical protein
MRGHSIISYIQILDHVVIAVLRIRDVYPGSEFFPSWFPDSRFKKIPGSRILIRIKECDPGCSFRIRILIFLPIPDPGVKKAPDPGSGSATLLNSGSCFFTLQMISCEGRGPEFSVTVVLFSTLFLPFSPSAETATMPPPPIPPFHLSWSFTPCIAGTCREEGDGQ